MLLVERALPSFFLAHKDVHRVMAPSLCSTQRRARIVDIVNHTIVDIVSLKRKGICQSLTPSAVYRVPT